MRHYAEGKGEGNTKKVRWGSNGKISIELSKGNKAKFGIEYEDDSVRVKNTRTNEETLIEDKLEE